MEKDKTKSIVFSNNESTETLFTKIEGWGITSQIEFAVSFDDPKRKELFQKIFEAVTNETEKQNISLIAQRIEQAAFQAIDYTHSEIVYYQSLFAQDFHTVLHSEYYQNHIEHKIRELYSYYKRIELDLKTRQYDFLEDREQDKTELIEAERYKLYLEKLLLHLKATTDQPIAKQTTELEQGNLDGTPQQQPQEKEKLSGLITHKNSVEIVEAIKIQYKNIKGKRLGFLWKALEGLQLLPKRNGAKFHRCCENEFEWDINSYQAMTQNNEWSNFDLKGELEVMKNFLETYIKSK